MIDTSRRVRSGITEVSYKFGDDMIVNEVSVGSTYRMERDTLVARGILKLPYTDTEEYRKDLKNRVLYWKNGKWNKYWELD